MRKVYRKTEYVFLGLLIVFFIVFTFYNFGFEIYTYSWHITNPRPIVLNNLRVTIPEGLVGRMADNNVVEVTYLKDPLKATIYLRQMDYEPASSICDMSLGTVEKSPCKISGKECIRLRFNRDYNDGYIEELYLTTEKAYISFQGDRSERKYLLKLIQDLEVI
ncbi:MAG: hypothetical protein Q7U10_09485 [Thermodesulfovibrionia bacterium]|nr:hypothetical protein [Thermodesulfovibrionia bacterium]